MLFEFCHQNNEILLGEKEILCDRDSQINSSMLSFICDGN